MLTDDDLDAAPAQVEKSPVQLLERGARVLVNGAPAIIADAYAEGTAFHPFPHYVCDYVDGERGIKVPPEHVTLAPAVQISRGLTGNLCDVETALKSGKYDVPLTQPVARGLLAALNVAPDVRAPRTEKALAERYRMPPFSVLDARKGDWQERKRQWLALGIKSEIGRGNLVDEISDDDDQDIAPALSLRKRKNPPAQPAQDAEQSGTSIFDPVLTECCYLWYSFQGAHVLDPFAGGSVRGIVAALLGRTYTGVDLRREQVTANEQQAQQILARFGVAHPRWIAGDSRHIATLIEGQSADYIFTCPPYADLEVYSEDPRDISTLEYPQFREAYRAIIAAACARLKPDRFATCVVGECRGPDEGGPYYGLVPDTIAVFEAAGLRYYNEQILVTMVGSLPLRTGKHFDVMRKVGKTHQNILTFCKGSPRRATDACGPILLKDPLNKR